MLLLPWYYWLQSKYKEPIKLSEAERVILENIEKDYKWIARDKSWENLYVYSSKPEKNEAKNWEPVEDAQDLLCFKHLFQFITWQDDEPYNIEELLEENKWQIKNIW